MHQPLAYNDKNYGCTCVPNDTHKSYFETQPISKLELSECKTNYDLSNCLYLLGNLEAQVASKCPTPCRKMDYKGEIFDVPGSYLILKDNEILMEIYFKTMNTEIHNEILTFDLATFIGTAGGSLGLFLGFSLTGFAEQILNFLMKN